MTTEPIRSRAGTPAPPALPVRPLAAPIYVDEVHSAPPKPMADTPSPPQPSIYYAALGVGMVVVAGATLLYMLALPFLAEMSRINQRVNALEQRVGELHAHVELLTGFMQRIRPRAFFNATLPTVQL